jgi:hypothetical protein
VSERYTGSSDPKDSRSWHVQLHCMVAFALVPGMVVVAAGCGCVPRSTTLLNRTGNHKGAIDCVLPKIAYVMELEIECGALSELVVVPEALR